MCDYDNLDYGTVRDWFNDDIEAEIEEALEEAMKRWHEGKMTERDKAILDRVLKQ